MQMKFHTNKSFQEKKRPGIEFFQESDQKEVLQFYLHCSSQLIIKEWAGSHSKKTFLEAVTVKDN